MPLLIACIFCLIAAFGFSKFLEAVMPPPNNGQPTKLDRGNVVIDSQTGCHYLSWNRGLAPRLDAQGRQICDPVVQPPAFKQQKGRVES